MKWEDLPQPWTREQCRRRYVEGGDDISLAKLARVSGVPLKTLERWSSPSFGDKRLPSWKEMRVSFEGKLRVSVSEKVIEKTSEKISDETVQVIKENYEAHKLVRNYITKIIQLKARQLSNSLKGKDESKLSSAEINEMTREHNATIINQWSQALDRSTKAINEIKGIKYSVDTNAAANKLITEGYDIPLKKKPKEWYDVV